MWWLHGLQNTLCPGVCSSVSPSINDFAVLRVISLLFFSPHFSFSLPFLPCLNYIFPEAPHLWQWSSAVSSGGVLWSQLNPPVSARSSPNLFPESPVLQLLLSTPGHSHTTRPPASQDPAITSRHQYTQGMDLSALLCVILPLCLSWSLCQERQVEGIK